VIARGEIHWADLGTASGSRPAKRRPILIVQSDPYNASRLATVVAVVITSNTALAAMPGNVFLPASATGLPRDSVVNVTALVTLNKTDLTDRVGPLSLAMMNEVDRGLRRALELYESNYQSTPVSVDRMNPWLPCVAQCTAPCRSTAQTPPMV
jgi:mRNA interferase MazF